MGLSVWLLVLSTILKTNKIMEDIYDDDTIDIHAETFDKDFDEVGFDPIEEDDSDNESAELYGFND